MAQITLKTGLTLETSVDATPGGASMGVSTVPTLTTGNSTSVQRVYSTYSANDISWTEIETLMSTGSSSTDYEGQRTISRTISRRGIRRPRGILYPRGTYQPYRRLFISRRIYRR